jgi:hypothetical protein
MISFVLLKTENCLPVRRRCPPSSLSSQFRISIFDFQFFDPVVQSLLPTRTHPH